MLLFLEFSTFYCFNDLDVQTYVSMENVHELSSPEQSLKSARLGEVKHPFEKPGASRETD